jgi:hypothetical protein
MIQAWAQQKTPVKAGVGSVLFGVCPELKKLSSPSEKVRP